MSANDSPRLPHLNVEMKLIEEAMRRELPVLGICLGAQLIAKTLGASVYPNREKEIGWYDVSPTDEAGCDPLLMDLQVMEKIFQWHGETFDIPRSACHLAFSPLCSNQAFRHGSKVYGFQFHLEVDEPMIHRWLRVAENREEIFALHGNDSIDQIHRETPEYIARLRDLSDRVFGEFITLFGVEKRFFTLPSR